MKYKNVEVFWLKNNENVFIHGPKSDLIKFLQEFLIVDSNVKNEDEHPLDLKKMKGVGITYSDLEEFLSHLVVSFEDEDDCSLCKKGIKENNIEYLKQVKNKNVYYFISTDESLISENDTSSSKKLYDFKITPFSEGKDLFYFKGVQEEFDFLKKVGKICYGIKWN